jgi:hypothetical protein
MGAVKLPMEERPRHLLLHGVPKTALPTDVLRALKDVGAVNDEFPLSGSEFYALTYPLLSIVVHS